MEKFSNTFPAFCTDIGAPRCVVGLKQLNRIYNYFGSRRPSLRKPANRFRFADSVFESLGKTCLPLQTAPGVPTINVELDVVSADIPALLGMDLMDRESLTPCTVMNKLIKRIPDDSSESGYKDIWNVPLYKASSGHLYAKMECAIPIHITKMQLARLHRQFSHPSTDKLFNLIRKARPEDATPETRRLLDEIVKHWAPFQRIQRAPRRFRVTMGTEHIQFNERVLMDVMYLDGRPLLHVVDEGTHMSAAQFLPNKSTKSVWNAFLKCWCNIYTGMPNRILVDQGTEFGSTFVHLAAECGATVDHTGVEAHSSLGLCERYHEPIRTIYRKLRTEHPNMPRDLALSLALKGMNDVSRPEGITPSSLVFGTYPPMHTPHESQPGKKDQTEREALIKKVTSDMEKHMAKMKISRALKHSTPQASKENFEVNDTVLVWRENTISNRIGEWLGPFSIKKIDRKRKLIWITEHQNPFNITQIKKYHPPDKCADQLMDQINNCFNLFSSPSLNCDIHLTEILHPTDLRASSPEMNEAKKAKIKGLLKRGTFKIILKRDVPKNGNILPGRFVLAIKSLVDRKIKFKARYVIGGHRDKLREYLIHSSNSTQPQSVRILLSLAALLDFELWGDDVKQAYLQSMKKLNREIFIYEAVPDFELEPEECLQLLKPLYGLCDSGDLWYATMDEHLRRDIGMIQSKLDPALYTLRVKNELKGILASYVDDLLCAGKQEMRDASLKMRETFEMDDETTTPIEFTGVIIKGNSKNGFSIEQDSYITEKPLPNLIESSTYKDFASARIKLAWMAETRIDCLYWINQFAQVTECSFSENRTDIIKKYNKVVLTVQKAIGIQYRKLEKNSLKILWFSDASFANNRDLSSQLGHIIFLTDKSDTVLPISFKSYKSKRITKSPMSAEVISFADMFDISISIKLELESMLDVKVPVQLLTDSKSLFDVIAKG